jgi:hypothetical protein
MKPKEYSKKYGFDKNPEAVFEQASMVSDLTADFLATIEYLQEAKQLNYSRFNTVKAEINQKYNSIRKFSKANDLIWNNIWSELNSQVIKSVEQNIFGDYLRKEKAKASQKRNEYSDYNRFRRAWEELLFAQLRKMSQHLVPQECFNTLGLPPSSTADQINKKFKQLALQHHPDMGGDHQTFVNIIDAKNRCLAFLSK